MMFPNRRAACVVVAAALVVAGCSSAGGKESSTRTTAVAAKVTTTIAEPTTTMPVVPLRHFDASRVYGLVFDHPRAWREVHYDDSGSFFISIVFLGTAPLYDPCTRTFYADGHPEGTACGSAIKSLRPGDVFVSWFTAGMQHGPGPEIAHPNTRIGGEPAEVTTLRPGECGQFDGQETITADIREDHDNEFGMMACLRSPNLARNAALVQRMLRSVHIRT